MFDLQAKQKSLALQALIDNAFKEQWAPESKIDFNQDVVVPNGIDGRTYIDMVSQLFYAEEATISIIGKMLNTVPDFQAKQYLCTQAIDEARHAQIYKSYLEKLGDIAPINEGLKSVLESGLNWQGSYCGSVVALNIVMEGEALQQQSKRIETLPCPLFKQINQAIIRDEARHAAFGRVYMREKLPLLCNDEKVEIVGWIKSLWGGWARANEGRYAIDGASILRTEGIELDQHWQFQAKIFKDIGLVS